MSFSHKFLVPDYYEDFHCKGGECRSTCCYGWDVSVTREEYFRLLGMDCPPDMRKRLDCAFHQPHDASPERFMLLSRRWDGDCPLRAQDGLCALQCECGEAILPAVCRYYPRGPRSEFNYECSCTNSCEKVLELLFDREEPLTFDMKELSFQFDLPKDVPLRNPRGYYNAIRRMCWDILHYRKFPLPERIWRIVHALHVIDPLLNGDPVEMMDALNRLSLCAEPLSMPQSDQADALNPMREFSAVLVENSVSLAEYHAAASAALPDLCAYEAASAHFAACFPNWQRDFENMMLNHMFYECFPFSDLHENLEDESLALCATYALVRYLTVGCMADKSSRNDYVDTAAAAFRLIEHSRFDHNSAILLRQMGCSKAEKLAGLLKL